MTAARHLNSQQFLPASEIGKMHSANMPGATLGQWHRTFTGNHPDVPLHEGGVTEPLSVIAGHTLWDGHHRYAAAKNAGQQEAPARHRQSFAVPASEPRKPTGLHGIADALRNIDFEAGS